jgi:hypothetical protein
VWGNREVYWNGTVNMCVKIGKAIFYTGLSRALRLKEVEAAITHHSLPKKYYRYSFLLESESIPGP